MGGGDNKEKLRIESEQKKDPVTMARETALWNKSQAYADTNPFSQQYGGPDAMPGMGAMSQAGQEYLTDSILGPGQYDAQNLGFTDYQSPDALPGSAQETLAARQAAQAAQAAQEAAAREAQAERWRLE